MRSLLALAGLALLFVFVAFLIAMATGAAAATFVDVDEPMSAAACTDLPMRDRAFGLAVGERVATPRCSGSIMAFACVGGEPGALLYVGPREVGCAVRVAELVRP